MALTKKQKTVFDYILQYIEKYEYSPTQKEIKEHFGLKSFGSVQKYLKYLSEAKYIETDYQARRGIVITHTTSCNNKTNAKDHNNDSSSIPIIGDIAAGNPIEAIETCDDFISVPSQMLKNNQKYFALRVQGTSMINAGILDNDIAICKIQNHANNGEIVAAVIDGCATLKKFFKAQEQITLFPENDSFQPIVIPYNMEENFCDFKIAGILAGLYRYY